MFLCAVKMNEPHSQSQIVVPSKGVPSLACMSTSVDWARCDLFPQGADHLTVTWKVDEGVYQHVDVREEGKENAFSLGRSLWIDSEVRIWRKQTVDHLLSIIDFIKT